MTKGQRIVAAAVALAKEGVDYSPRSGATCPFCGAARIPVYKTMPWDGNCRVRYHKCRNSRCLLQKMDVGVKSVQHN